MRWPQFVRLTLSFDEISADRKERIDNAQRTRAVAANGGWARL